MKHRKCKDKTCHLPRNHPPINVTLGVGPTMHHCDGLPHYCQFAYPPTTLVLNEQRTESR